MIEGLRQLKQEIIENSPKNSNWCVFSYKDDFETLWKENSIPPCSNSEDTGINILIIWDGMPKPSQGANILDHLTPFDWALSFSYQLLRNKDNRLEKIKLHILDCYSLHQPNAFSVKMLPALCHAMPWMKVFRPCSLNEEYGPRLLLSDLYGLLQDDSQNFDRIGQDALDQVESIVHAWQGSVARSTDHHGINNILGPIVLGKSMGIEIGNKFDNETNSLWAGLSEHASRMGMTTKSEESSKTKGLLKDIKGGICKNARKLGRIDFVLIDDQPAWEKVLGQICKHDIEDHLASFERFKSFDDVNSQWEAGDYRGKMKPHLQKGDLQVLFADLRLFSDSKEEIAYFTQSIEYAERVLYNLEKSKAERPWKDNDFSSEKLSSLKDKIGNIVAHDYKDCKEFQKDNAYLELLTIRVRAIAQADPLLPIILFSSSGQRHILESVRGYKNIITDLEKPRFFGYQDGDSAVVFLRTFKDSLNKAVILLTSRVALQRLHEVADTARGKSGDDEGTYDDCYIEIFFDESGDDAISDKRNNSLSVGGIALLYSGNSLNGEKKASDLHALIESKKIKIKLPDQFDNLETLPEERGKKKSYPLIWCGTGKKRIDKYLGCEKLTRTEIYKKAEYREKKKYKEAGYNILKDHLLPQIKEVSLLREYIDSWYCFNIKSLKQFKQDYDFFNETNIDNLNLTLIRWLLDSVIYEFFQHNLSKYKKINIQIYGATRLRFKVDSPNPRFTPDEKSKLLSKFGISIDDDACINKKEAGKFYASLRRDSMLHIMTSIKNSRAGNWSDKIKLEGALCSTLRDDVCPLVRKKPFRHIHYMADIVPRVGNSGNHNQLVNAFKQLTEEANIMTDTGDECFELALDAGRCLDSGDMTGALLRAWSAAMKHGQNNRKEANPNSIVPIICKRVVAELSQLDGETLMEFGGGLDHWETSLNISKLRSGVKSPSGYKRKKQLNKNVKKKVKRQDKKKDFNKPAKASTTAKPMSKPDKTESDNKAKVIGFVDHL